MILLACSASQALAAQQPPLIRLGLEPQHLAYPSHLPTRGYSFSEVLFVNYSTLLANKTITIQYYYNSLWWNLTAFTGNSVGFTQLYVPVTAYWAHSGANILRAVSGVYASNNITLTVSENSNGFELDALLYTALISFALGLIFLADKVKPKKFILAMLALYVVIAPFTGQRYDVYFLVTSGIRVLEHVNPFNPGQPPVYPYPLKWAYPPLYPPYSALSFLVYSWVTHNTIPTVSNTVYPGYYTAVYSVWRGYVTPSMPILVFLLKLPMIASFVAVYRVLSVRVGERTALKQWAANPLALLVCCVWGQLDPIATALTLLSLDSYSRGRMTQAYLWAALGGAIKLWPAVVIPIYLAQGVRLQRARLFRPVVLGVLPVAAASVGVYAYFGHPLQTLDILVYARSVPTYAGEFSVNGLTWQWILYFLDSPPIPLFLIVGPIVYAAILVYAYKKPEADPITLLIIVVLTLFLTYNYVNPQYFLWIVPLLILQKRTNSVWIFTALPLIFVGLSYNVFYFLSPALLYDTYAPAASIAEELKLAFFYNNRPLFIAVASILPLLAYICELTSQVKRILV
ncbi:MAG: hypothetical protein QW514_06175 [Thermoprotei archaeon]